MLYLYAVHLPQTHAYGHFFNSIKLAYCFSWISRARSSQNTRQMEILCSRMEKQCSFFSLCLPANGFYSWMPDVLGQLADMWPNVNAIRHTIMHSRIEQSPSSSSRDKFHEYLTIWLLIKFVFKNIRQNYHFPFGLIEFIQKYAWLRQLMLNFKCKFGLSQFAWNSNYYINENSTMNFKHINALNLLPPPAVCRTISIVASE